MREQVKNTVKLQTYSWISSVLGMPESSNGVLEKEIEDGATLASIFTELARAYPEFRKLIFDPDKGQLSDQVLVIFNDRLLQLKDLKETHDQPQRPHSHLPHTGRRIHRRCLCRHSERPGRLM
jgi:hypothetical protein